LEFRRHVLKRFTSSVLWLSLRQRRAGEIVKHVLYGTAASIAMGFAVAAALWAGPPEQARHIGGWILAAVVAYALKDRIKASLQHL
jgi:hypothetical protein